jgi:DNA-binding CsgD family transcriptional regulator
MRVGVLPIIFCLSLVPGIQAQGQVVDKPFVINYDKRAYGADNQNWSVAVSNSGLVYAGNDKGLLEFDGSNWKLYPMPDHGIVRAIALGDDGSIFVGSYEEFGYWKTDITGRLNYFSLSDSLVSQGSLHNDEIWRIIQHDGKVYFQSFSNIFVFNGQQISILNPGYSMVLLMKAGGRLFIHLVGKGLFEIIDDSFRLVPGSDEFAYNEIKVVLPYGGNQFLIGVSGKGLYLFDGASFRYWESPVNNNRIRNCELNNGIAGHNRLVIGTIGDGLFVLDDSGNLLEHLNSLNFLQNNTVLALAFDKSGNIWAGLDRGLDLINLNSGLDFYVDPSGTMGSVYASVLDGQDLLIGTNQGLYRYQFTDGEGYTNPVPVPGLAGQVWDLKNFDGEILCGHTSGTYRINQSQVEEVSGINGGFELKRIQDRNRDILLQSTYSAFAVYTHQSGRWKLAFPVQGFFEPITSFENDLTGDLWCAHATRGIFRIRLKPDLSATEKVEMYGISHGLPSDRLTQVAKMEGRIVFPTGQGLYLWDDLNDTIVPYSRLNQQLGEFCNARQIIKTRENHYWLVLSNEVALFRITGFEVHEIFRYDLTKQGLFLTSRFTKIIALKEGLHLICLDNGFALLDESRMREDSSIPAVSIREVTVAGRDGERMYLPLQTGDKPTRIPYSHRSISIVFSAGTDCRLPIFRTRLEGLDTETTSWNSDSYVTYTRLPWGDYRLFVEARGVNGKAGKGVSYPFTIRPPWFFSILAFIMYGFVLVLGMLLLRINFIKRLALHKQKIEQEEAFKREQATLKAEQEMIRLKSEHLEAEVNFKNIQLADFTMSVIKRNEQLRRIRDEFQKQAQLRGSSPSSAFVERITRLIDQQLTSEDDWQTFETHFDQAHQDFIKRLKITYPHLTQSDLKLCAYLRLNITTKEIAHLLNISVRGVEVRRYRLRKRLKMNTEENLYDFLLTY